MASTRFLFNDTLWGEIQRRLKNGKRAYAAVAYLGKDGADLLPLRSGDELVVDLSLGSVGQGVTDPREIRKLMRKGVKVFSRRSLHAKFFLIDNLLIAGSANISRNSLTALDEAGIATTDAAALRRAKAFFEQLCTEPVRPLYLKECIKKYRPPRFKAAIEPGKRQKGSKRIPVAKVWFIGGLRNYSIPEGEQPHVEKAERRARRLLRREESEVDYIHNPFKPSYFAHIRAGEWVVPCIRDSGGARRAWVWAPQQLLTLESYPRGAGKRRYLVMTERSSASEGMPLSDFRRKIRRSLPELDTNGPRTRPIEDDAKADEILRLWTRAGKISHRR